MPALREIRSSQKTGRGWLSAQIDSFSGLCLLQQWVTVYACRERVVFFLFSNVLISFYNSSLYDHPLPSSMKLAQCTLSLLLASWVAGLARPSHRYMVGPSSAWALRQRLSDALEISNALALEYDLQNETSFHAAASLCPRTFKSRSGNVAFWISEPWKPSPTFVISNSEQDRRFSSFFYAELEEKSTRCTQLGGRRRKREREVHHWKARRVDFVAEIPAEKRFHH